ncbi:DUF1149 family protein [Streptococcus parauberis]|uniref:DUF1149 family protein n=3 Tax=Streptococcus parauberis TaxID=1348 RepID=A0A0E2UC22_9STRE|nr:DUF1149 family protein [Streptococcus parauberis]AEF25035.1 hypothetical protein STP_0587 [Streptococcus parauberis KCTC 11537]AUT05811.1 hypothetical protein SPSF3K_01086 [Streptococcus parauberis]EGE53868.1 hypothetical protein SPB_0335 [Streptococcus parauberis NCFD 2020]EMF49616.1 hypothetical protein SPJ2_0436 [Streptococcus parauberis KRS-02109]EMG26103.1 Hypothetical protein SPJ1_0065 [Streptococcus parauberis KRS-02083]
MQLIREKEFVNQYHYDARNLEWEAENGIPETNFEVTFQLIDKDEEKNETVIVSVLQFVIVKDEFVISGVISQMVKIVDRLIEKPSEFSQEEVESLAAPLLDMVQRLTFEVTEIALDRPGFNLEFKN